MTRRRAARLLVAAVAAIVLAALIVVLSDALGGPEFVFPSGSPYGARIESCPAADCSPLFRAAEASLDRSQPGHPPVVRERLGAPACSTGPAHLCAISPPLGTRDILEVVLDLAGRTDPVLVDVQCMGTATPDRVPWDGGWCFAP